MGFGHSPTLPFTHSPSIPFTYIEEVMWIAKAEHGRRIDQRASEEFGVAAKCLMERAGQAVFEAVKEFVPTGSHVAVFCGKGNNGGDGFVVARIARDHGYFVECIVAALEADLKGLAAEQKQIAQEQGVCMTFSDSEKWAKKLDCVAHRDLLVDALLGTGAKSEVQGPIKEAIQAINRSGVPVISIDLPSGIECDTGQELGESVWACRTVTMGQPKPCFFQGIGLEHSGYWNVADIGYPEELLDEPTEAKLIEEGWVGCMLPERLRASHKRDNGSLLIVAGSRNMPGAATLVASAALRSGTGLVTVASIPSVCDIVAHHLPEVLLFPLPEKDGVIAPEAADLLLQKQSAYSAAAFGPGMTNDGPVMEFLSALWRHWTKPCVIDADALNCVAKGIALPKADCVLTPHAGEMSRLLQMSAAEIQAERLKMTQQAASRFHTCVLLKGPFTVVAESNQPILVNTTGNPGMATGGMGDTLTGIIATLLAEDLPAYCATACGAYWHGLAADLCACEIGPVGYTATEVSNKLPAARVRIHASCESKPPC
ncbi:MAG: NAD(P)H-hydrate dehydratase [Fimbriimonadales bacterium]